MKILPFNIAILDEPDQLCGWVEEARKLCHDASVGVHYLPHINTGDVVVDAGAAIGDHTIAYMEKAGASNVHAFEVNPKMVECLRHNCPGAHIYPFALSNYVGSIFFHADREGNAGKGYVSSEHQSSVGYCITLDSLNLPRVDFIKWDIEGFEHRAIAGAEKTIKRCRPKMMVEIHQEFLQRAGSSMLELECFIQSLGYRISTAIGNRSEGRYEAICIPV